MALEIIVLGTLRTSQILQQETCKEMNLPHLLWSFDFADVAAASFISFSTKTSGEYSFICFHYKGKVAGRAYSIL